METLKLVEITAGCGRKVYIGKGRRTYAKGMLACFKYLLRVNSVPGVKVKNINFLPAGVARCLSVYL